MTTIIIELNKLDADPKNVRKTYSSESIAALAASITVNGVLQNLVVRAGDKKGRYFVTAGERRRRALLLLLEQGDIQKNHAVECKVRDGEDATEISLNEATGARFPRSHLQGASTQGGCTSFPFMPLLR